MVRLNGTRGKHRKTKMHKNKSNKFKRGGIVLTKEQLITIIHDKNKISPRNIQDLIDESHLKQKRLMNMQKLNL